MNVILLSALILKFISLIRFPKHIPINAVILVPFHTREPPETESGNLIRLKFGPPEAFSHYATQLRILISVPDSWIVWIFFVIVKIVYFLTKTASDYST